MRLMNARLCLDCEEVHDQQHCPICSSESFAFLTRWVTPSDTATAEAAPRTTRPPESRRAARAGRRLSSDPQPGAVAQSRTARGAWRARAGASRRRAHGVARRTRTRDRFETATSNRFTERRVVTPSSPCRSTVLIVAAAVMVLLQLAAAQTKITIPKNKYTPEQDVQLGRQAAAEVRKQYPVITDSALAGYLDRLGKRLVAAAPPELNNPVFEYSFTPVNLKDINAFALPGGPMFVNRGMFEAATGEGEVVGVMAHELSHVLLRHGTANATKAQGFQLGQLAGAIAGAVVGGGWGQVISEGSSFGLGTALLKYSREYEKQADLLGVQMHGACGLRSERPGADVRDHPEGGARARTRVAEQPPRPWQPLELHRQGSGDAERGPAGAARCRVSAGAGTLRLAAAAQVHGRAGASQQRRCPIAPDDGLRPARPSANWRSRSGAVIAPSPGRKPLRCRGARNWRTLSANSDHP